MEGAQGEGRGGGVSKSEMKNCLSHCLRFQHSALAASTCLQHCQDLRAVSPRPSSLEGALQNLMCEIGNCSGFQWFAVRVSTGALQFWACSLWCSL